MKNAPDRAVAATSLLALVAGGCLDLSSFQARYPETPRVDVVDEYHGTEVPDPYRWLEDADSPETIAWVRAQNELTEDFLGRVGERSRIRGRLEELWDHERFGLPVERGGRTFFTRNDGLRPQPVLVVVEGAVERVLLDPNRLSADGSVSLAEFHPSPDGTLLAYALSDGGSDWRTWHVLDVATGAVAPDVVAENKFGGAVWDARGAGFYYPRYPRPAAGDALVAENAPPEIRYHRLGTPEAEDVLVQPAPEAGELFRLEPSSDRSALVITTFDVATWHAEIALAPLPATADSPRIPVVTEADADYAYVGDDGETLWLRTDLDAPRNRILAVPLEAAADRGRWAELVAEDEVATLQAASHVGDRLVLRYLVDASSRVRLHATDGALERELELGDFGTAAGFDGDPSSPRTYYSFTTFLQPPTIRALDVETGRSTVFRRPLVDFDASEYETYQVFYESKDARTRVPMFLTHRKDLDLEGENPTYLYGYGGFGVSLTPFFRVQHLVWLEMGGILAVPSLRGGGEYGEAWHEAGRRAAKQNVFDDFAYAARWLVRREYTTPSKIAIAGGSNGGLLVGACMTQEPWLYGAALPSVGVLDMLRFHRFTIGWAWTGEYGSPEDPEQFRVLHEYSPLHNLREGETYPATLVTTSDHDDRVVPAHSYKFVAELQRVQGGAAPVLLRVETRAGHGAGKSTRVQLEQAADELAFLHEVLAMERL